MRTAVRALLRGSRARRGLPATVLLALAAASPAGPPQPDPEAVSANERGLAALAAGEPARAVEHFERALARSEGAWSVRANLAAALAAEGAALERAGRHEEAVGRLDRAIELRPRRLVYRYARARARVALGREGERFFAREDLAVVLEGDPDHRPSLVLLGSIAWLERRLEQAVAAWERALRLDPDDPGLRERLERARRELAVEEDYHALRGAHFLVRHAPEIPAAFASGVLTLCETAWGDLCPRFGHYPEEEVVVTLYPGRALQDALRLHRWVAGVSDGTIRIRVPEGAGVAELGPVLRHEFAHHLIRRVAPRTPPWLHEGLAQAAEGGSGPRAAEARLRAHDGLRNSDLAFAAVQRPDFAAARRFYDLAYAFTEWLRELGGEAALAGMLEDLGHGLTEEQALIRRFGAGRADLFERWRRHLRAG